MRYLFALLILLAGCTDNINVISITPVTDYAPTIGEQAAQLSYSGNDIRVAGYVGQFKIKLANNTDTTISNVFLLATVNDPALVGDIFFSRIYHQIFWGGDVFYEDTSTALLAPQIKPSFNGFATTLEGDDIPPHSYLTFDSVVLGNAGLKLNIEVYGGQNDRVVYSVEEHGTTIEFNY